MKLLFIGDPQSVHDLKWMSSVGKYHEIHLLRRKIHQFNSNRLNEIVEHGVLNDFSAIKPIRTLRSLFFLKQVIKRNKIDLVHILYTEPNALWAIFRKYLKIPILLTTRGSDILLAITNHFESASVQNLYVRKLYRTAFRRSSAVTCTSSSQKQRVLELFKISHEPIIIRTGMQIPESSNFLISDLPEELHEGKFVLMPRMMRPVYNHEFTLSAIAKLPEDILLQYKFVFIDYESQAISYVELIQKKMKLIPKGRFVFLPMLEQPDLYNLYYYSNLVIMNPISDGTPVSGLEAMYFETPLILGPLDYDTDLFGNWIHKLQEWNADELASLICNCLKESNPEEKTKAKEVVQNIGNTEKEMKKLLDLYNEIVM